MTTKRKWDNYRFTSQRELHIYSPWARLSSYLWKLICWCDWRSCCNWGGILDASRKNRRKILGCAGLRIGCHSIPLWSDHDHDHDLVALFGTLGFEYECLLFSADVELYDPSWNINRGSGGTKNGFPRMSGIWRQISISSTMKSTGMKEFLILTGISSAIPTGRQFDWSASCRCREIGTEESWFS
jgi:hypothetical protein